MHPHPLAFERLSDTDLVAQVNYLCSSERQATAALIAAIAELDARRLYLVAGCSSLFTYCTQVLGLSEDCAYFRIEAARAVRRYPVILTRLAEGTITLTAVKLLAPHLTQDNHVEVLHQASGGSKRQIEEIVARLHPVPDVRSTIRKLPERAPSSLLSDAAAEPAPAPDTPATPAPAVPAAPRVAASSVPHRTLIAPLAPARYKVQMTVSADTHQKLRQAQELLRHTIPDGDPAAVFDARSRCSWSS